MGGPAGSGGSDKSDERKVDTYADQLKKEQARKSKFKTNKFGYKVKKNPIERYVDNSPVMRIVGNTADKLNLNRRMKFANKNNINLQGLSTEQILSKDFKSQLDAKGYTREPGNVGGGGNDRSDNNQPILEASIPEQGMNEEVVTEPLETSSEYNLTDEEIALRNKRKGRKKTVLTSVTGDTSEATLGKKTLLGG